MTAEPTFDDLLPVLEEVERQAPSLSEAERALLGMIFALRLLGPLRGDGLLALARGFGFARDDVVQARQGMVERGWVRPARDGEGGALGWELVREDETP